MQPHPQHSPRSRDAWAEPDAKPKKRAKKAVAKKKPVARKAAPKKATAKKKAKAATKKKKPLKGAKSPVEVADLVARLLEHEAARQALASFAPDRSGSDELGEAAELAALRRELADSQRKLAHLEQKLVDLESLRQRLPLLESRVAELSTLLADMQARSSLDLFNPDEVIADPFAWIRRDPSIVQYHGQHVALHPTRGVIAHGFQLDAVVAEVRASGLPLDDIVLDFISDSPF
ncbi:hypothetical protein [Nannocystis pusilla]|uniref:hypothetical protein n=1 Tax=Nannocystis pusilla TaxID=889268 RepID=UPI003DA51178